MKKYSTYEFNNRTFRVYVGECGYGLVDVVVREVVHPERKFFKTRYFYQNIYCTEDFEEISDIERSAIARGFELEEQHQAYEAKMERWRQE